MNLEIDESEYKKQLKYFNDYYGSEFRKNQGTEEILDAIHNYSVPGTLADFGSGSNIYFWLLAFNEIIKVLCVDVSKEAFLISDYIKEGILIPESCNYAIAKYGVSLESVRKIDVNQLILDIFEGNLEIEDRFNNVSQFGLLGLCQNEEEYISNLKKLFSLLKLNGVFLGANWHFSKQYSSVKGFNNNYLDIDLIEKASRELKAEILLLKKVPIVNDENYDYVLIYALKND